MVLYCALVKVEPSTGAVMRQVSGGGGVGGWVPDSPEIMTSSSSCPWETATPLSRHWNSEIVAHYLCASEDYVQYSLLKSLSAI